MMDVLATKNVDKNLEEEGNIYNRRKPWINYDEQPRGIATAHSTPIYEKPRVVDVVKSTFGSEPTEADKSPQEERPYSQVDYKKRYDDLKRHYDQKLQEFRDKENSYEKKLLEAVPRFKPPKTKEELETFRKSNPELFDVVQSVAHEMSNSHLEELKKQVNSLQLRELQLARVNAEAVISKRHPDFADIRESDDFHEWAKAQPEQIQDWLYKNTSDPYLVIRALDMYKIDRGDNKEPPVEETTRQATQDAASAVMTRQTPGPQTTSLKTWTTSEINAMPIWEYEKHREDIDRAFLEGRIVRDTR